MTDLNEIPKAKKHYPRCLRFVLKGVWFDKIKSGEKCIEYREVKPYWDKRIRNLYHFNNTPDYNKCIFTRGYTNKMLIAEIESIQIINGGNTDLHVDKNVYAIHIKNVKEYGV